MPDLDVLGITGQKEKLTAGELMKDSMEVLIKKEVKEQHLKILSDTVGVRLKEFTTVVTWRQTTNYAASMGDMNHRHIDDLRGGGIVAPPIFAVEATPG